LITFHPTKAENMPGVRFLITSNTYTCNKTAKFRSCKKNRHSVNTGFKSKENHPQQQLGVDYLYEKSRGYNWLAQ